MLDSLRNFDANRASIVDMVSLRAYARTVVSEFENFSIEVPEWITNQVKALDRQIVAKRADSLEARKREVTARLENLKTPSEKKAELTRELKKLTELTTV